MIVASSRSSECEDTLQEWHEVVERVQEELQSLQEEIDAVGPLLRKLTQVEPDEVEMRAAAATLHAFYSGVERLLLVIARRCDASTPQSIRWHRELLDQVALPTDSRPRVISSQLHSQLIEYLGFRHVFRHNYSGTLRWAQCVGLVQALEETCSRLQQEVLAFIEGYAD